MDERALLWFHGVEYATGVSILYVTQELGGIFGRHGFHVLRGIDRVHGREELRRFFNAIVTVCIEFVEGNLNFFLNLGDLGKSVVENALPLSKSFVAIAEFLFPLDEPALFLFQGLGEWSGGVLFFDFGGCRIFSSVSSV